MLWFILGLFIGGGIALFFFALFSIRWKRERRAMREYIIYIERAFEGLHRENTRLCEMNTRLKGEGAHNDGRTAAD